MKRAYCDSRVIFDIDNNQYIVEAKRHWYSRWEFYKCIFVNQYMSDAKAKEGAVSCANALVNQVVIHRGLK